MYDGGPKDANIVNRTVIVVTHLTLYAIGNIHAFDDLAENGVCPVKMGCSSLAGDDVELTCAGEMIGVYIIALACRCHRAIAMAYGGRLNFWLQFVGQVTSTQQRARLSMTAVGVAGLNHKVWYDTVEE